MTHTHYLRYKDYYSNYAKVHAEQKRQNLKKYYHQKKDEVIKLLGNKCKKCGFDDPRALQIDHINGGGTREKRSATKMYIKYILEEIKRGSKKYQLLCANCNWIKRDENNENTTKRIY